VAQLIEALCCKPESQGSILDDVIGFSIYLILQPHYGPGIDSVPNKNVCQEFFLGGGGKEQPSRNSDNLSAICKSTV
jgi:hypothetical protein